MMKYNSDEIAKILPHRYPFALVDRIVDGEEGKWAKGIKCVTVNEPFFQGHFPQYHVMPGVLIVEAALFGGIKNARFRRQVTPGDVLEIECTLTKQKGPVGIGEAKATVDGQVAATAELTFALVNAPEGSV